MGAVMAVVLCSLTMPKASLPSTSSFTTTFCLGQENTSPAMVSIVSDIVASTPRPELYAM